MLKLSKQRSLAVAALALLFASPFAAAADAEPASSARASTANANDLRICASENEPPYSYKDGTGFENRIATLVAEAMNRKPVFVWTKRPAIYLVSEFLQKDECDVVVGLDTGDNRVLTTQPYYRAGYVFVSRVDRDIAIKDWKDPKLAAMSHIATGLGSSGEAMLKKIGKYEDNMAYMYSLVDFKAPRNQYVRVDPSRQVKEVADGNADIAIGFAPELARYVRDSSVPLRMQTVPADDTGGGDPIEFVFAQSMGVRSNDKALLDGLNAALAKAAPKIREILQQEGVPPVPAQS